MRGDVLLSGHVLRIAVRRHRWHITLHDLRTGRVRTFRSFAALNAYLERVSSQPTLDTPVKRC